MLQALRQADLFAGVLDAMAAGAATNGQIYQRVADQAGISGDAMEAKVAIGKSGQRHSPVKRKIRWVQQTLRALGLIERVEGARGLWQLTDAGEKKLTKALPEVAMLAFSTDLGIAIWGNCNRVTPYLDEPIALMITSPPYPIRRARAYGGPTIADYTDFICRALEPVVANLVPGGSIVLNVSNDIFEKGSPARSTYLERLIIALEDRLGLALMDRVPWINLSKPPGPIAWASKSRQQMNAAWEPMIWMTNDPLRVKADNRRVLLPHTKEHLKLLAAGGENRTATYGDGAYRIRPGSYGKPTLGRIPKNALVLGHACADHRQYRKDAAYLGLPAHGAPMPKAIYDFWIKFLTEPGDLCADIFAGRLTLGKSAEELGRRWCVTEQILEYVRAGAERFTGYAGFQMNDAITGFRGREYMIKGVM
jgi:site-specific DNA-methyltransferase (cytosine-N4-specific)